MTEPFRAAGPTIVLEEWSHGPNDGPPLHVHHNDDEAWHVLEGRLRFRFADGSARDVGAGQTMFAAAGLAHTYGALTDVRYLIVTTPRVRALIAALHDGSGRDQREVFREYRSEILE